MFLQGLRRKMMIIKIKIKCKGVEVLLKLWLKCIHAIHSPTGNANH
jgi:hypothetical protein